MRWTGAVYSTYSSLYVLRDFYLLCFYSFWDGLVLTTLLFIGIFHSCLFFIYGGIFTDCIWPVQSARWAGAVYILFSLCVTRFLQIVLFQLLRWATYCTYPSILSEFSLLVISLSMAEFSLIWPVLFSPRGGLVLSTPTMVIVSLVLLILGLVIGGFLSSCYNSGCGQVQQQLFVY